MYTIGYPRFRSKVSVRNRVKDFDFHNSNLITPHDPNLCIRYFKKNFDCRDSISLFVGSWNCVYQEFPDDVIFGLNSACRTNKREKGYSSLVNGNECTTASELSEGTNVAVDTTPCIRASTKALVPPIDAEPLSDWIVPGYDIYAISLQEALSGKFLRSIGTYLSCYNKGEYVPLKLRRYKLSGYGDGAILHTKSTNLGVWVRRDLLDNGSVILVDSKAIALSFINRSKGAIVALLEIHGQRVAIVGGHLPAKNSDRDRAALYIIQSMVHAFSKGKSEQLSNVFDHIVWTGDFNFRTFGIAATDALELLKNNERHKLFAFDELHSGKATTFNLFGFREAPVRFDPTFKKRDDRKPTDKARQDWEQEEYHVRFERQWYKGKNIVERVPSWTDRVLVWSKPGMQRRIVIDAQSYTAATPKTTSLLLASDHSPVACGLVILPDA